MGVNIGTIKRVLDWDVGTTPGDYYTGRKERGE